MTEKNRSTERIYLTVVAEFSPEGEMTPLHFVWPDGRKYEIDHVEDVRPAASLKVGGKGMRYLCRVRDRYFYLFYDQDRWFYAPLS